MNLLTATGVTKSYGAVRVLDDVTFELRAGEVHALVGENGAGKSTLIKILGGAVVPDAGVVRLGGVQLKAGDPRDTRRQGLSIVYQEFTLVPDMSVFDNLMLGREAGPLLRAGAHDVRIRAVLRDLELDVHPDTLVRDLSVARQQLVEIARALLTEARVVVLDEPTAALSGREVDRLMHVVRQLRDRGLGIVYVSHRFEEIFALADRVTVLRDGRLVAVASTVDVDRPTLIRWMVGRDVSEEFPPRSTVPAAAVLEVEHLSGPPRFHDVSLSVRAGEIVGLAGLVGAGRTSLALALVGAVPSRGRVRLDGVPVACSSPSQAIARGIAYVTEDRKSRGILPQMTTGENVTLTSLAHFTRAGVLSVGRERRVASATASRFAVRSAGLGQPAGTLSGGNQQKALLARFLLLPRRVVVLDEPTRGVDVGARAEIYGLMNHLTREGLGILMISSDLPELLGMSDRVVVMRGGRTVGALVRPEATPEAVMALATGA